MPHIVHTSDLDWQEDPRFPGVALQLLVSKTHTPEASLIHVLVKPGHQISTHVHDHETEFVYVMAGTAVLTLADNDYTLTAGACGVIPPGIPHSLHTLGDETVELMAIHSPPTR